jgi:hypothetical protein
MSLQSHLNFKHQCNKILKYNILHKLTFQLYFSNGGDNESQDIYSNIRNTLSKQIHGHFAYLIAAEV